MEVSAVVAVGALIPPAVALVAALYAILSWRAALSRGRAALLRGAPPGRLHAAVVSLSPAWHSPRALNHARALSVSGRFVVTLHACGEPFSAGDDACVAYAPIRALSRRGAYSSGLARRALAQAWDVAHALALRRGAARADVVLVNSPPCIPVLAVVWAAARALHGARVVVDWHNFGYSIMAVGGAARGVVRVAEWVEWWCGRRMDGHFCVSRAMAAFLAEWGVDARVVYDRPPERWGRVGRLREVHALFESLERCAGMGAEGMGGTVATVCEGGEVRLREDRPFVVVSSTSWTPDEDLGMLQDALVALDARLAGKGGRDVLCVVTGDGPMRAAFEARQRGLRLRRVRCVCVWLPKDDYPRLLGCADLGVSLHRSSSGVDLPMKVVDMLGCGLPVASYDYACIRELVRPGKTGVLFGTAEELAAHLFALLCTDEGRAQRAAMQKHVGEQFAREEMRWQRSWERDALPLLLELCGQPGGKRRDE